MNITTFFLIILQALATLRQKLRKYNKDFEEEILKYREVSWLISVEIFLLFRVVRLVLWPSTVVNAATGRILALELSSVDQGQHTEKNNSSYMACL